MCLILLAWRVSPEYPLVVASNRDEFFDRPSVPAAFWSDAPNVLAGRDLQAGGSWMGITRQLRFAAVTNYREPRPAELPTTSRGHLVADFLTGRRRPDTYLKEIARRGASYNGYNLLVADRDSLWYHSNRGVAPRELPPGIYGLSNNLLDEPWPKLSVARQRFEQSLDSLPDLHPFFELLEDDSVAPDAELPDTGVGIELERALSSVFVRLPHYGTRASTVMLVRADNSIRFVERRFGAGKAPAGGTDVAFMAEG